MSEKGLTNISLKKINKSKVYQYIYRKKKTSNQQIVQDLEPEGLIEKKRLFCIHRRKKSKRHSDCIRF